MRTIRLDLDPDLFDALATSATHDLRTIPSQVEHFLRAALNVPFRSMADDLADGGVLLRDVREEAPRGSAA